MNVKIGLASVSDRASLSVFPDIGISALQDWLGLALLTLFTTLTRLITD